MPPGKHQVQMLDAALAHLAEVLAYTEKEWGEEQREAYSSDLWKSIETLASAPEIGKKRDELSSGMRSYPSGRRLIYYWLRDDTIFIARILHSHRDPGGEEW